MTTQPTPRMVAYLAHLADPAGVGVPDGELLRRFAESRDEAAFELLVWRHGGLVMGACRRVLGPSADADDAFQAAFLALARQATSVRRGDAVAAWLHRVAVRAAVRLRTAAIRRRAVPLPEVAAPPVAPFDDTAAVLDEEIGRLPEKYRVVFVLCELDGRTDAEAAAVLGCPKGTVLSRLSRARERLRQRLTRRGVAPAVGVPVAPPAGLVVETVRTGVGFAAGTATGPAAALATEVLRAPALGVWKPVAAALALALVTAAVVGGGRAPQPAGPEARAAEPATRLGDERFLHPAEVTQVLFSPDGKEVATLGGAALRWWAVADGTLAAEPAKAGDQKLTAAIAPVVSADNGTLVQVRPTAGLGSVLVAYDPRTLQARTRIAVPDNFGLTALRLSHNGKWAVGKGGKTVVVWNLAAGKKAASFEAEGVRNLAVSNDGKRVAIDSDFFKTEIRAAEMGELIWDVKTALPPQAENTPPLRDLESYEALAFSPDGKKLATTGSVAAGGEPFPAPVRLWDIETKKHLWERHINDGAGQAIGREVRFSPDGKFVATLYANLHLLEAASGKVAHTFVPSVGATGNYAIANDGGRVAMPAGRRLRLWETGTGKEPDALVGPRAPARLLARSADGRFVATGNGGPEVWLWVAAGGKPRAVRASADYWAFDLGFGPDGKSLVTVSRGNDDPIRVWDPATGKERFRLGGGADKLHRAALGRHGLFAVRDYVPGLYDAETGQAIWTGQAVKAVGNNEPLVVIGPGAEYFATDTGVFSITTGHAVAVFEALHPVALSADGKRLAYRTADGKIGTFLTTALSQAEPVKVGETYAVSPTADRVAMVELTALKVIDLTTGKTIAECERPAGLADEAWRLWFARGVRFSPDGKRLAAHGDAPGVGVWDAATGKPIAWLGPDVGLPLALYAFTDATTVVAAYGSGDLIRVWEVAKGGR